MGRPLRIAMVAGEISGDQLGTALIREIRARRADVAFEGIAGPGMRAAGCRALADAEQLAMMGFVEVLRHLPRLLRLRRRLLRYFTEHPPDLYVGIDAPDFNLPVERRLKRRGVKTLHWVSPSVWAWREKRVERIRDSVDRMLTLFPFEADFYRQRGVDAEFVGHPLADDIDADCPPGRVRPELGLAIRRPCLALLPGSRSGEIERLLPLFLRTAQRCRASVPQLQFVLPVATPALRPLCSRYIAQSGLDVTLLDGAARAAMCAADVVLLASGTAALECMLVKRPMVVAYRINPLSYALVKRLLRVPYVSLPNNLLGRMQVPEYLQAAATPEQLTAALLPLLQAPEQAAAQVAPFGATARSLRRGAAGRVADIVLEALPAT